MPSFRLFRKSKKQEAPEKDAVAPLEPEKTDVPQVENKPEPEAPAASKAYLKAMPLKDLADLPAVKEEVQNGNILILRITPLASKSIDDVKNAVNELYAFTESIGGDIARLGEERVVICPKNIKIWREKTPEKVAVSNEVLPTAA
jgi:SepF-like predicted cell division protein (DUF552 family)